MSCSPGHLWAEATRAVNELGDVFPRGKRASGEVTLCEVKTTIPPRPLVPSWLSPSERDAAHVRVCRRLSRELIRPDHERNLCRRVFHQIDVSLGLVD